MIWLRVHHRGWERNMWRFHSREYYCALKKDSLETCVENWVQLETVMLRETEETEETQQRERCTVKATRRRCAHGPGQFKNN